MRPQCKHHGTNHSRDIVRVLTGRPTALYLCGYHASQVTPAMLAQLNGSDR